MKTIDSIALLKRMEIINRVSFFRQFELSERQLLMESFSHWYSVKKGDFVFNRFEKDNALYIVLSGKLAIFRQSDERHLGYIEPGEFVGEGAFLSHRERSTNAQAIEETIVLALDSQLLTQLPSSIREKVKDQIILGMSSRISQLSSVLESLRE